MEETYFWKHRRAEELVGEGGFIRIICDGAARESSQTSACAFAVLFNLSGLAGNVPVILGLGAVYKSQFWPAWRQELEAVNLALGFLGALGPGSPAPGPLGHASPFPPAVRGCAERALRPWLHL